MLSRSQSGWDGMLSRSKRAVVTVLFSDYGSWFRSATPFSELSQYLQLCFAVLRQVSQIVFRKFRKYEFRNAWTRGKKGKRRGNHDFFMSAWSFLRLRRLIVVLKAGRGFSTIVHIDWQCQSICLRRVIVVLKAGMKAGRGFSTIVHIDWQCQSIQYEQFFVLFINMNKIKQSIWTKFSSSLLRFDDFVLMRFHCRMCLLSVSHFMMNAWQFVTVLVWDLRHFFDLYVVAGLPRKSQASFLGDKGWHVHYLCTPFIKSARLQEYKAFCCLDDSKPLPWMQCAEMFSSILNEQQASGGQFHLTISCLVEVVYMYLCYAVASFEAQNSWVLQRKLKKNNDMSRNFHVRRVSIANTIALLPSVKRQVFCVGDRLKMVKHKAWATTIVAPKLVESMTTKGQMKPTCRVSLTASQAG